MLSINETQKIKGILILLIVLGHTKELFSFYSQAILYSFHITSFFFLPFLFNKEKLTKKNLFKILRRLYIPYTIFFVLSLMLYTFIFRQELDTVAIFNTWISGNATLLRKTIGLSTFWFFPAFFSTLVLIMLYNSVSNIWKNILLITMSFSHVFISLLPSTILQQTLFDSYVIFYIFIIGIAIKKLYFKYKWREIPLWILLASLVFCSFLIYGEKFNIASPLIPQITKNPLNFILHDLIMILGFFAVVRIGILVPKLENIGKYSLAIYTIHPFVIQSVNKIYNWTSLFDGLLKFILVCVVTYSLTLVIYKTRVNKIIYPR